MKSYNPHEIEPKWQQTWAETGIYKAIDFDERPKYVMLTEFPYPSGDGLHSGHAREYTIGDVMARHKRMQGYNVLYPMGYDAFGLPTENYAIKTGVTPQAATAQNIANFRKQFDSLGLGFDWDRQVNTTDPDYYRWTQWLFLQFHKTGLAYQKEMAINWCPKEKTGLANEEVVNGRHERCGTLVEKKLLKQWMLSITKYADRLIEGLKDVDYPDRISNQQINWIGRSEGAEIDFNVGDETITVYTTRPDTLAGATFMVLAPEHPAVQKITTDAQKGKVDSYIKAAQSQSEIARTDESREKTGVATGAHATNPLNGEQIPVYIADYVLMGYGTGAIMAVPAHDQRDFEFATKYQIPIKQVIAPEYPDNVNPPKPGHDFIERNIAQVIVKHPTEDKIIILEHRHMNDAKYSFVIGGIEGEETPEEAAVRETIEETGYKNIKNTYELGKEYSGRFWHPLKQLNRHAHFVNVVVELADLEQGEIAEEEVAKHNIHWVSLSEADKYMIWPIAQDILDLYRGNGKAISDPGFLIHSGEFNGLPSDDAKAKITKYLEAQGVARKAVKYRLRDWIFSRQHYWGEPIPIIHCEKCGAVPVPENQLPVVLPKVESYEVGENGESPLAAIDEWVNVECPECGTPAKRETDTMPNWAGSSWYYLRYFDPKNDQAFADPKKLKYWGAVDMYLGGMEHTTLHLLYSRFWHQFFYDQKLVPTPEPYATRRGQGIVLAADGRKMSKSLGNVINPTDVIAKTGADALRLYILFMAPYDESTAWSEEHLAGVSRFLYRIWDLLHKPIAESADSLEMDRAMHKAIQKVGDHIEQMRFNTAISTLMECVNALNKFESLTPTVARQLTLLLAPLAPHMAEEVWHELGEAQSIHIASWPVFDPELVKDDVVEVAIQVNGKLRGTMPASVDASKEELEAAAKDIESVKKYLDGGEIIKTIVIPNRMVSFVVKS
jgi:leucyl-tRNA synthetase